PLDRAELIGASADQRRVQPLRRRVGRLGGIGSERAGDAGLADRERPPRQHVEAQHRLRERLNVTQRAGWNARRHVAARRRVRARHEWIEPADRREQSRAGEQSPLPQLAPWKLPLRQCLDDLAPVVARPGCLPQPRPRHFPPQVQSAHTYLLLNWLTDGQFLTRTRARLSDDRFRCRLGTVRASGSWRASAGDDATTIAGAKVWPSPSRHGSYSWSSLAEGADAIRPVPAAVKSILAGLPSRMAGEYKSS